MEAVIKSLLFYNWQRKVGCPHSCHRRVDFSQPLHYRYQNHSKCALSASSTCPKIRRFSGILPNGVSAETHYL